MKPLPLMKLIRIIAVLVLLLSASRPSSAQAPIINDSRRANDSGLQRLEREIARLAESAGGVVGVSATHLETNRRVSINATQRFPMASTYKVPIAVELLTRVDQGEIRLDQMTHLQPSDIRPGGGILTDLLNQPGLALSVRNLMELMLLISDNSATDVCLRLVGGPQVVTERMRKLGIDGIDVNRTTARLIGDWAGIAKAPPETEWSPTVFRMLAEAVKPDERKAAAARFDTDPRDTATPEAMMGLLEQIYRKGAIRRESTDLLLDILRRSRTGPARLKGMLPVGTEVAHKTGSIGGSTNDVGVITLPDDAGQVVIAIYVKSSPNEESVRERAIADIGRAVYDFFLFQER